MTYSLHTGAMPRIITRPVRWVILLLAFLIVVSPCAASAQENGWEFELAAYFWYASIGGDTAANSELDIDADQLIDNLELAFMGAFGARKDRWSFLADAIYFNVEDDQQVTVGGSSGLAATANLDVEVSSWIFSPMAGYRVAETDRFKLDVLAGARYLYLKTDVTVGVNTPAGALQNRVSDSGDIWDGIVGVRGEIQLGANFFMPFLLDIGAGESDLTWQAYGGIGYRFNNFDVVAAYRYLDWEFENDQAFDNMNVSGPMAGIKFRF